MGKIFILFGHLCAATCALVYAWVVSSTEYFQTGLQFIGPALVIITVHLLWLTARGGLQVGFSQVVFGRSVQTALTLVLTLFAASILAPQPAHAGPEEALPWFFMSVFCILIIAIVGGIILWIIRLITFGANKIKQSMDDDNGPRTRFFDVATLGVVSALLTAACLEGLPNTFKFNSYGTSTAMQVIEADSETVWTALGTATSPDFPLPNFLMSFPRPTEVTIDQGVKLGALRRVEFNGREGSGALTLQVTDRTPTSVTFTVLSDTSPYADWVGYSNLTYTTVSQGDQTKLSVQLGFTRRLAPAWFFGPAIKGSAYLAMDVLARDVKNRAESLL